MSICKYCNETIVFNTRREKKFCSDKCRRDFFNKQDKEKRALKKKIVVKSDDDDDENLSTIQDPLEYIRQNHGGNIDFDAGMLLTFGFLKGFDKVKQSMKPIIHEYRTNGY